jgi:hypothetical protein
LPPTVCGDADVRTRGNLLLGVSPFRGAASSAHANVRVGRCGYLFGRGRCSLARRLCTAMTSEIGTRAVAAKSGPQ